VLAAWDTNWQDKDGKPEIPEECDPFEPPIREVLASSSVASDALGSTWGSKGVFRAPAQNTLWGWNATDAGNIAAPTLIIRGLRDVQAPEPPQRLLFADLKAAQKVFVRVACAGHQLLFENRQTLWFRLQEVLRIARGAGATIAGIGAIVRRWNRQLTLSAVTSPFPSAGRNCRWT